MYIGHYNVIKSLMKKYPEETFVLLQDGFELPIRKVSEDKIWLENHERGIPFKNIPIEQVKIPDVAKNTIVGQQKASTYLRTMRR